MGGPGSGRYPPKEKGAPKGHQWDAVTWLKSHPEDIPLARENLAARDRGFEDDDVKQLMAAICLEACVDYKHAIRPNVAMTKYGIKTINELHIFFGQEMFQYFVNGMPVEEIEAAIRRTPEGAIKSLWKQSENNQASKTHLK